MRRVDSRVVLGALLVLAGLLLLLQNLNLLPAGFDLFWAFLFGVSGLAFLALFSDNRDRWWALIPGFTLLSLGILIVVQATAPGAARIWGGPLFLGGIGLSFWAIYLVRREYWWAIIPGGVLFTLAAVAAVSELVGGREAGTIFFLGLSLTFGLVYLLPTPRGRMSWALIPAGVLLLFAIFLATNFVLVSQIVWPILLILIGFYLLFRSFRSRSGPEV